MREVMYVPNLRGTYPSMDVLIVVVDDSALPGLMKPNASSERPLMSSLQRRLSLRLRCTDLRSYSSTGAAWPTKWSRYNNTALIKIVSKTSTIGQDLPLDLPPWLSTSWLGSLSRHLPLLLGPYFQETCVSQARQSTSARQSGRVVHCLESAS